MSDPQPIETAPLDGRWLLVCDPTRQYPKTWHGPWVIASRSDAATGWSDDNGDDVAPTHWVALPDPQPEPSKWLPVEGVICVEEITGVGWTINGKPASLPWRWMIYIERSDGTYDEYRETSHKVTVIDARRCAKKWENQYGLPVVFRPLPNKLNTVVIQ